MSPNQNRTRVVVIGGGPGGYPAAFYASDLGMDVTLVDLDLWARSVAPHGLPGDDLFVDYCHMNEEGYWLAGAEVSRVIQESGILSH